MQPALTTEPRVDSCELLERLFQEHHASVLRAAYQITGDLSESEDVLQTVFVRLLQREASQLAQIGRAYLKRAAINAALDVVRSRKIVPLEDLEGSLCQDSAGPERLCSASELRKWFRGAMARLNPTAAEIFALKFFHDLSNREIADLLGTSPGVIAVTLHRTRSRLQNEIESIQGEKS